MRALSDAEVNFRHKPHVWSRGVARWFRLSLNSIRYVAAAVLLKHRFNRFSHRGLVLRVNEGQILLHLRGPFLRAHQQFGTACQNNRDLNR
jgi:hypothetical protein